MVDADAGLAYGRRAALEESALPIPRPRAVRSIVVAIVIAASLVSAGNVAAASQAGHGGASRGYDISWPQCGGAYPANPLFGIVGVNRGIVFSPNPCLASEITWAGGARAQLYANTANPGPQLSSHWPNGQTSPRFCDPANPDTADCAFDYGYNAAADSYADAVAAYQSLRLSGTPAGATWWLDVETSNSWRADTSLNVAALQGEASYLLSAAHVAGLGFYSTQLQWNEIAGGSAVFAAYPSWVAGARSQKAAASRCAGSGFTGGGVELAQYPSGGFDADLVC